MKRKTTFLAVTFVMLLVCNPAPHLVAVPAPEKEVNLIVNGSFEEGPEPEGVRGFKPLEPDSTEIKGWVVTRAPIDWIDTYWQNADGKRSLDLHGSPGIGGVKQTFKTKKGKKYRVTFSLSANSDGQMAEKKLGVQAAGKEHTFTVSAEGKSREDMAWEKQTWEFTAVDKETTLEFYSLMTEDAAYGPALDNVRVVEVKK